MRRIQYVVMVLAVVSQLCACGGPEDVTAKAKQDLKDALTAYYSNKLDSFCLCVDFGTELDTVQKQVMMAAYRRDIAYTQEHYNGVRNVEPKSVQFEDDTTAFVIYDIVYGNQQRETSSQKMVRAGDSWKLRVRN